MSITGTRSVDSGVFWPAVIIAGGFVLWGGLAPDSLATVATATLNTIIKTFGWMFVVSTAFFLMFAVFLAVGRFGKIKLGRDDEKPEFSTVSWVCMMFSVGMGIGLMFWGVAEPVFHFGAPPHGMAEPQSREAAVVAMQYAYFHWALHPWAIYAVVGLALAYFSYRRNLPTLM
jgi:glycine betaine transporter